MRRATSQGSGNGGRHLSTYSCIHVGTNVSPLFTKVRGIGEETCTLGGWRGEGRDTYIQRDARCEHTSSLPPELVARVSRTTSRLCP